MKVTEIRFTPVPGHVASGGLLGFVRFVLDGRFVVDGVGVRRTRDGRPVLNFPSRRDRQGVEHFAIRPLNDQTRREIEHQILTALAADVEAR
jgi:DNA-binding cell septation regulator SpoVG